MRLWEYILEIPFESRRLFLGKKNAKYSFKGNAYYLLDKDGMVLRDFVQLSGEKITYRPNDNDMMIGTEGKGTDYWNSKRTKEFRLKNFAKSSINKDVFEGDSALIKKLNEDALAYHNTSLRMNGLISGSNTSGADLKIDATPYWSIDNMYYGMRFVNPMKMMRLKVGNRNSIQHYNITNEQLKISSKLSLEDYINIFPKTKKHFVKYNPEMISLFSKNEDEETQKIYFFEIGDKIKGEYKSYESLANRYIDKYNDHVIDRDKLIERLRGILRNLLLIEQKLINEPVVIGRHEKLSNLDAAHLVDVAYIKKGNDSDLWKIADVNNGLLLPKDIHWKLDKDNDFDINDNFEFIENGIVKYKINDKYKNDERREYINSRSR